MKNKDAQAVFMAAVVKKIKAAEALNMKASWQTRDHLAALATVLAVVPKGEAIETEFLELLEDCYNISGFSQMLSKVPALKAKGHFQRDVAGVKSTNDIEAMLNAQLGAM